MDELTDEEVFGATPKAFELSDAEVFGGAAGVSAVGSALVGSPITNLEPIKGAGEAALSLGSQMALMPGIGVGAVADIAGQAVKSTFEDFPSIKAPDVDLAGVAGRIEQAYEHGTYAPRTETGKATTEAVGNVLMLPQEHVIQPISTSMGKAARLVAESLFGLDVETATKYEGATAALWDATINVATMEIIGRGGARPRAEPTQLEFPLSGGEAKLPEGRTPEGKLLHEPEIVPAAEAQIQTELPLTLTDFDVGLPQKQMRDTLAGVDSLRNKLDELGVSGQSQDAQAHAQLAFDKLRPELDALLERNAPALADIPRPAPDVSYLEAVPQYRAALERVASTVKLAEEALPDMLSAGKLRTAYDTPPAALMDMLNGGVPAEMEYSPHLYFKKTLKPASSGATKAINNASGPVTEASNRVSIGQPLGVAVDARLYSKGTTLVGFKALAAEDAKLVRGMYEFAEDFRKRTIPNETLIISDGDALNKLVTQQGGKRADDAGLIWRDSNGAWRIDIFRENVRSLDRLPLTLGHELGHAVAMARLYSSPEAVRLAVAQDYIHFMRDSLEKPLFAVINSKFSAIHARDVASYLKKYFPTVEGEVYTVPLKELYRANLPIGLREHINYWLSADEWIADQHLRYAENPEWGGARGLRGSLSGHFFIRTAELIKRVYASSDVAAYERFAPTANYVRWLKEMQEQKNLDTVIGHTAGRTLAEGMDRLASKGVIDPPGAASAVHQNPWAQAGELDRFNKAMEWTYSIWQIAELNPHIQGLKGFTAELGAMAQTKNRHLHKAEARLVEMNNLGKGRAARLGSMLFEETLGGKSFDLNDINVIKKYQLDSEMVTTARRIKQDFADGLDSMEKIFLARIIKNWSHDPLKMQAETVKLQAQFAALRSKPYFPLARFGNYTVVAKAIDDTVIDGKIYKKGTVIDMRSFESRAEQLKGAKEVAADYAGNKAVSVGKDYIEDVVFEFRGMPPQVLDALRGELKLTKRQQDQLTQYQYDVAPGQSFLKHMKRRNGVLGFAEDVERGYASYMMRLSNHIARLQHYEKLSAHTASVADDAKRIQMAGTPEAVSDAVKRRKIHQYMAETYDYIMNPANEWTGVRSMAFQFHLGLNVKSAFVNLFQVLMATYPKLAYEFGDVRAVAAMTRAVGHVTDLWRRPSRVSQELRDAVAWGIDAGVLDQSFASMVAGVSEGHLLSRALPGTAGARLIRQLGHVTSFMFANMEKFNRQITFISAYDLARKAGKSIDEARETGRRVVRSTQFEYGKWARPKAFRGRKGSLLVFKSYQQGMLYFLFHDKARARAWLMLGGTAGLMGLPFAEDIADIVDWAGSWGNEKFDSRRSLRELIKNLHIKPDLILHGTSRESFGFAALSSYLGIPAPRVDLSGSLGMGRVVPGVEALQPSAKGFSEKVGRLTADAMGAGFAPMIAAAQVAADWDVQPNKLRLVEKALPSALRSITKAFRYENEGGYTDAKGAKLVPMSWQDSEQRMEIIGQALGFTPTRIAGRQEQDRMIRNSAEFYALRQQKLLADFAYARIERDREAIADVKDAIKRYNDEVPEQTLRINGSMLAKSVRSRLRNIAKTEHGRAPKGRRYQGLQRDIEQLFREESDLTDDFVFGTTPPPSD